MGDESASRRDKNLKRRPDPKHLFRTFESEVRADRRSTASDSSIGKAGGPRRGPSCRRLLFGRGNCELELPARRGEARRGEARRLSAPRFPLFRREFSREKGTIGQRHRVLDSTEPFSSRIQRGAARASPAKSSLRCRSWPSRTENRSGLFESRPPLESPANGAAAWAAIGERGASRRKMDAAFSGATASPIREERVGVQSKEKRIGGYSRRKRTRKESRGAGIP